MTLTTCWKLEGFKYSSCNCWGGKLFVSKHCYYQQRVIGLSQGTSKTLLLIRGLTVSTFQIASTLIPQEGFYLNCLPSLCWHVSMALRPKSVIKIKLGGKKRYVENNSNKTRSEGLACNLATNNPLTEHIYRTDF